VIAVLITEALAKEMQDKWLEKNDAPNAEAKRSQLVEI
jgi:hypothetical protein